MIIRLAELEKEIKSNLQLRPGTKNILRNRESTQLEFKETFNLGSRAKYAKTMASFANNKGGFVVFGVAPSPHLLKGVNESLFEACDPSKLTEFMCAHFSPDLEWEMGLFTFKGFTLGFIFTHEAADKPVIAIANSGAEVSEGAIYYRYKARSTTIRYPELRHLLEDRINRERKAWLQHFQSISQAGPLNVGIVDTIKGHLYGSGPPFLIDEALLRKIRFVRRGRFSETTGEPTLRLVGDVVPVGGLEKETPVSVGIHAEDLYTAFLAQRALTESEARAYFKEVSYQSSPYSPMFYFRNLGHLSHEEAIEIVKKSTSSYPSTIKELLQRLKAVRRLGTIGKLEPPTPLPKLITSDLLLEALGSAQTEKKKRAILFITLKERPHLIEETLPKLPIVRLCEAITHLDAKSLRDKKKEILHILLSIYTTSFSLMTSYEKWAFRRAVAFADEMLDKGA